MRIKKEKIDRYVCGAMKSVKCKYYIEDNTYIAEIQGFSGVWGSGENLKESIDNLNEVLREWLMLKIKDCNNDIPIIENINLNLV